MPSVPSTVQPSEPFLVHVLVVPTAGARALNLIERCRDKGGFAKRESPSMLRDIRGHVLSGATAKSLPHYEAAVRQLNLFIDDPVASVDKAIAESPHFTMAYALRAWLHLLGTEPAGLAIARGALELTQGLPATAQELGHLAAIRHLVEG